MTTWQVSSKTPELAQACQETLPLCGERVGWGSAGFKLFPDNPDTSHFPACKTGLKKITVYFSKFCSPLFRVQAPPEEDSGSCAGTALGSTERSEALLPVC